MASFFNVQVIGMSEGQNFSGAGTEDEDSILVFLGGNDEGTQLVGAH